MIAVDPDYCPLCGAAVEHRRIDGRERAYCPGCERVLWRNAVPAAGVAVVDGDRVCCIRRATHPAEGAWAIPGGHPEYDEPLLVGAARELREETGLSVDPTELAVVDTGYAPGPERNHVGVQFAVEREATTGQLRPGKEAADVAFLTPDEYDEREELVHDRGTVTAAIAEF